MIYCVAQTHTSSPFLPSQLDSALLSEDLSLTTSQQMTEVKNAR